VVFLCYNYNVNFNVDLTLLSIAIIFPLVFTIRGSFRRREKALEHLSEFRATLKIVHHFLMSNNKLTEEQKIDVDKILLEVNYKVLDHLAGSDHSTKDMDEIVNKVYAFVLSENDNVSTRLKDRVFRFMRDVHKSIENLHAIHTHRTPISLKAYCKVFIFVFPIIYAPVIINEIGIDANQWITYLVVLTTEFILISLFNIQDQLEYPFDNIGMDDINLDAFKIDR